MDIIEDFILCGYVIEFWINGEDVGCNFLLVFGLVIKFYLLFGFGVWVDFGVEIGLVIGG